MEYAVFSVLLLLLLVLTYRLSKKNAKDVILLGRLSIFASLIYITWRIFFTIPSNSVISAILGIILILFELLGFFQAVMLHFLFTSKRQVQLQKDAPFLKKPMIDIFICTYNEPVEILKRTIVAASMVNYPKSKRQVYVGDDGRRKEVEKLCKKLKVNYITRENNKHAKAGNLNNLLSVSSGEFALVLDADFIVKTNIIEKMLPYFEDSKMGFVQVPQVFYNLDPYQYNLGFNNHIPNEQEFFMRSIAEKRSHFNATLQLGTNTLFRRTALEEIGGIPTGSITEDMATGMLIQNAGYKSYYLNECLAIGLAVESFEDFIKQRDRWARGNLQVMQKYKPFQLNNLTFLQKLIYWSGSLYWLFGLQKIVYIAFPLLYLIFGIPILNANAVLLLLYFVPSYVGSTLYYKKISNQSRSMLWSNIYETSIAPHLAYAVIKEWFFSGMKRLKFFVTPKGKKQVQKNFKLKLAMVHLLFAFLTVTSWVFMVLNIVRDTNLTLSEILMYAILFFWTFYHFVPLISSILLCLEKPRYRSSERIPISLKMNTILNTKEQIKELGYFGTTVDISETGAKVVLHRNCPFSLLDKNKIIRMKIEKIGTMNARIVRLYEQGNKKYLAVEFIRPNKKIIHYINQTRFLKLNGCTQNGETYTRTNIFSILLIILFENFILKQEEKQ